MPPMLRELDLSNQKRANTGGGLSGTIPMDIYKLVDLSALNLAGNIFSGEIPTSIGNLDKLKLLNLSSNQLSEQIPSEVGRLQSKCRTRSFCQILLRYPLTFVSTNCCVAASTRCY